MGVRETPPARAPATNARRINRRRLTEDAATSTPVGALKRAALLTIYGAVLLAPLLLIVRGAKPGAHDILVVFADALGFAAMSLLSLRVFSSGQWVATTRPFGLRCVLSLHRQAGMAALVLVVAHIAILFGDDPARLALLDVVTAPGRARAGVAALLALLGLAGTSVWRRHVRLRCEQRRAVHLVLTVVVIGGALSLSRRSIRTPRRALCAGVGSGWSSGRP